jgi:general secretion pathway protein B
VSYILDALRKSDQLRQRGAAPTLLLGQATATAPKQPALLRYGLLALVLLGAGIAIGWLRPWQPEPPAPAVVAAKPPEPELKAQNSAPAMPAVPAPAPAPVPARPQGSASAQLKRQTAPPRVAAKAPQKAAVPEPGRGSASGPAGAAPLPAVMAMADLPLALQQELAPMSISVHAYSGKARDRLVGINSRLLHEGEDVAPGLRLEQITPDGMILSYKGYRFRRGVH